MKSYPSKVSPILIIILLLPVWLSVYEMINLNNYTNWWVLPLIFIPILVLVFSIRYIIDDKHLIIRIMGFKYSKIAIFSITSIKNTYNPLSSPAASVKRLDISYGKFKNVLVSPRNKESFIATLLAINPEIIVKILLVFFLL